MSAIWLAKWHYGRHVMKGKTKNLLVVAAIAAAAVAGATTATHAASQSSCVAAHPGARTPFVRVIDPDGHVKSTTIYNVVRLERDANAFNDVYVLSACVR